MEVVDTKNVIDLIRKTVLSADPSARISNHQGRLQARDFRPMLMSLYDNDPLQFPFNWDNFEKNGAPVCSWVIQNDSVFLT
jgi:hypothetical protein